VSFITLAEGKQALRVTQTSEDALIQIYIDAACELCEEYCNRQFGPIAPASVKSAALLALCDLFNNRESQIVGPSVSENRAFKDLLFSSMDFDGNSVASIEVDGEGILIGDTFSRDWQWLDSTGAPINVSGYTAVFKLGGTEYQATILNAVEGRFSVTLSATQTSELAAVKTLYTLKVTSPTGVVTTLDRKTVSIQ
jgi:hypothetical protein